MQEFLELKRDFFDKKRKLGATGSQHEKKKGLSVSKNKGNTSHETSALTIHTLRSIEKLLYTNNELLHQQCTLIKKVLEKDTENVPESAMTQQGKRRSPQSSGDYVSDTAIAIEARS